MDEKELKRKVKGFMAEFDKKKLFTHEAVGNIVFGVLKVVYDVK